MFVLRDFFKKEGKEETPVFIEEIEELEDMDIVRLKGPIDMFTVPDIEDLRKKAIREKNFLKKNVLLDFKSVTHVDGATCAMLVSIVSELKHEKQCLALINVSLELKNMMDISMIGKMFTIYETETEAIIQLKKKEGV